MKEQHIEEKKIKKMYDAAIAHVKSNGLVYDFGSEEKAATVEAFVAGIKWKETVHGENLQEAYDLVNWWNEQFIIADAERNELKQKLQSPSLPVEQGEVGNKLQKAIDWCDEKLAYYESINLTKCGESSRYTVNEIKTHLECLHSTPPENYNTRVIEYLKGKLEKYRGIFVRQAINDWIKELEEEDVKEKL